MFGCFFGMRPHLVLDQLNMLRNIAIIRICIAPSRIQINSLGNC